MEAEMVTLNKFYFIFQRIFLLLLVILTIQGCQSNKEWLKITPAPTPNEYILTTFNEKQYSWLNEKEKKLIGKKIRNFSSIGRNNTKIYPRKNGTV